MSDILSIIRQKLIKFFFHCFFIFKIKKNRIFLMNYNGKGYGDSQKYISEELLKDDYYEIVWAVNNIESPFPKKIIKVKRNSIKYFYYLSTSKVLINNCRFPLFFTKRKEQYYIQTWHSPLRLKKIEMDAKSNFSKYYILTMKNDSKYIDEILSGCKFSYDIYSRAFLYSGKISKTGTPRCDVFFDEKNKVSLKKRLTRELNLDSRKKIILYAPTYRKNCSMNDVMMNIKKVYGKISNNYELLVRFHPLTKKIDLQKNIKNVTCYPDIQELLTISDILITDYSSCLFDMLIAEKKCILLLKDIKNYLQKERNLYFDINELPFPKAYTDDELICIIKNYDKYYNKNQMNKFKRKIGLYEHGNAAFLVKKRIDSIVKEGKKI